MLTITPAAKMRFQAITDVGIPERWVLSLDTPRMNRRHTEHRYVCRRAPGR
jgi:hypothetical protein